MIDLLIFERSRNLGFGHDFFALCVRNLLTLFKNFMRKKFKCEQLKKKMENRWIRHALDESASSYPPPPASRGAASPLHFPESGDHSARL